MRFRELLDIAGDEPVFETGFILAGAADRFDVHRQLSRWAVDGRLLQLRRGLYALAPPYQRVSPHPFLVANRLVPASYVSLQSALEHHGLIPERVPVVTSVTTGRPGLRETPLGRFHYRHVPTARLTGFRREQLQPGQRADVATAAKALIDLISLVPNADDRRYLEALRLDLSEHIELSSPEWDRTPKLRRAFQHLTALAAEGHAEIVEVLR